MVHVLVRITGELDKVLEAFVFFLVFDVRSVGGRLVLCSLTVSKL